MTNPADAPLKSQRGAPPKRGNSKARKGGPRPKKIKPVSAAADSTKQETTRTTSASATAKPSNNNSNAISNSSTNNMLLTDKRFAELDISNESRRALAQVFAYEFMTPVQAETLPLIMNGTDVLAKAKTGTGKTLGFLIPTIERILHHKGRNSQDIGCLVISPARELAFQIASEAESLLRFHKNMNVVTCVGGTNIKKDITALKKNSVEIIVATPGRLIDHLENNNLAARMDNLDVLVLDEADQILDQGFRAELLKIFASLKPSARTRQTLLFSATVPQSVEDIAGLALKQKYDFVDTVGDADQTHLHVKQELISAQPANQIAAVASLLHRETQSQPFKVIVFFTTARLTGFMADFFRACNPGYEVLDIHSRKSQAARKKASDRFRDVKNAVLFSSDVSARGMDYPDVTFVLQVGLSERAQYIHRLGRTARAGKEGKGTLLLAPYEERPMKKELSDMPLEATPLPSLDTTEAMVTRGFEAMQQSESIQLAARQAYGAWLGYYKGNLRKLNWKTDQLVTTANQFAFDSGLEEQPRLQRKTVGKMGLKGVPGILIEETSFGGGDRGGRGGGGRGNGGNAYRGGGGRGGGRGNGGSGRGGRGRRN